ncbi:hypothetical protein K432DRAFT_224959 [Lepidopterella palustris CBS 459.81]|uniref:Uncharacterized protein n=1 Tax=Lepidopterella palustris CBS 459.81 TaxID=1314670 RepID=A0A8E2EE92_9PEZI|nr:hypothetical protein K432DRAFT_224959 [Lepidopterella palustris CBS 459.81]
MSCLALRLTIQHSIMQRIRENNSTRALRVGALQNSGNARTMVGNFWSDHIHLGNVTNNFSRCSPIAIGFSCILILGGLVGLFIGLWKAGDFEHGNSSPSVLSKSPDGSGTSMQTLSGQETLPSIATALSFFVTVPSGQSSITTASYSRGSRPSHPAKASAVTTPALAPASSHISVISSTPASSTAISAAAAISLQSLSTSPGSSPSSGMTSILFGATGPPKTLLWFGTTTVCTRWSGLGCPGDSCYANTCVDPLPCWDGTCCTSGCDVGWPCTGSCVLNLVCTTIANETVGTCSTTTG